MLNNVTLGGWPLNNTPGGSDLYKEFPGPQQQGHVAPIGQQFQNAQNFFDQHRVKRRCNFVKQNGFRPKGQSAGNRHPRF